MRSRARLLEAVDFTRFLGFMCDADLVDTTARTEPLLVHNEDVEVVQIHALVAGADGAARLAKVLRLYEDSTDDDALVRWRSWTGWIDVGPDDALLSIRVTTTEVVNMGTSASAAIVGWQRPKHEELQ
jgi:hypothetical protein